MPDDNQTTNDPSVTGPTSQGASTDTGADATTTTGEENIDPNLVIPSLDDLEYATPSAYIDPDLPAYNPDADNAPEEPEEEAPADETIEMTPEQIAEAIKASNLVMAKVAEKIANSRNILIALSSDPSVDELASAICLSMFLDRLGKHAIAIYSGAVPEALGFLNPQNTFEDSADVLQDFVISLDKEKADHLRYKLEGDFVKIFITPYRDRIDAENLEFSYGDYNVDLCLALNIANGIDLDPALREYGRIMHDATVVNISTGNPGKFGEVEWNNRHASSISEMVANLFLSSNGDTKLNADEATALLTGIVAATDRFARANTFPSTMEVSSRLLDFGADQQLVAANISDDLDNQFFTFSEASAKAKREAEAKEAEGLENPSFSFESTEDLTKDDAPSDGSALQISHGEEEKPKDSQSSKDDSEDSKSDEPKMEAPKSEESKPEEPKPEEPKPEEDSALLDELKATEASLSGVGAETAPTPQPEPVQLNTTPAPTPNIPTPTQEMNIAPTNSTYSGVTNKYSQMLEDALAEPTATSGAPMESALPPVENPAATSAPTVSATPEMGGMPDINYGQTSDQVLPPPPAPPIDLNSPMPTPAPTDLPPTATPTDTTASFTIPGV